MNPEHDLKLKLKRLAQRSKAAKNWQLLGTSVLSLSVVCILTGLLLPEEALIQNEFFRYSLVFLAVTYFAIRLYLRRIKVSSIDIISKLETQNDDLNERLYTAFELLQKDEKLNIFERELVLEVLNHDKEKHWETSLIPKAPETLRNNFIFGTIVFIILSQSISSHFPEKAPRMKMFVEQRDEKELPQLEFSGLEVLPGDTEIAKGKALLVTARFSAQLPSQVNLFSKSEESQQTIEMKKSLGDPVFAGTISNLQVDTEYWLEFEYEGEEYTSEVFTAKVFEFPKLEKLSAHLKYPEYLKQAEKSLEDTRLITTISGTKATLTFNFNKQVTKAYLENKSGEIPLTATSETNVYELSQTLEKSAKYKIIAIDENDRQNLFPPTLTVKVYKNSKPKFKIQFPGKDLRISPIAELEVKAKVSDDVELLDYGIEFDYKENIQSYSAKEATAQGKEGSLQYQFKFEEIQAEPNELISWRLWANDVGNDGQVRKTYTDIYFIEFRHLEEIAREMKSSGPPMEGEGENAELIKVQKDIIAATWKKLNSILIEDFSDKMIKDLQVIEDSQRKATELAQALLIMLPPNLQTYVVDAKDEMKNATVALQSSFTDQDEEQLSKALKAEQKALRQLLHLNSKMKNIKQQQSQSQSSRSNKSEEMKDRLNLEKEKKKRYETKTSAKKEEERQQERDILNALKELAQRQMDLNDQIKKLQTELAKAEDAKEKEDLERQLKRLLEEQQELVRDAEKLQEKMTDENSREKMAQESEKMQQIKEQMQRTAQELKERRLQDSINSGKRAERNLANLKEDVKKKTASEFAEELRELKEQAKNLEEQIADIRKESENAQESKPSLTSKGQQRELADELKQSSKDMQQLLEDLKETTKNSEESQAAMSRELYNALRESHIKDTKGTLDDSERLMRQGFKQESQEKTAKAEKEIQQLSQAIDQAAEKVLGNEKEGLQQAKDEIEKLQGQLAGQIGEEGKRKQGKGNRNQEEGERSQESNSRSQEEGKGSEQKSGNSQQKQQASNQQGKGQQAANQEAGKGQGERVQKSGNRVQQEQQQAGKGQQTANPQGQSDASPTQGGGDNGGMEQVQNWDARKGKPKEFKEMIGDLRNIEDLLQNQELRQQVASIRDRMRQMEMDKKRFSKKPNVDQIRKKLFEPLSELQKEISEELAKMNDTKGKVRMDKDPIPEKYEEQVRSYFNRLGKGEE
ncbi:MAG: hypothetical protein MK132_21510 [Lentisphaerales bacterium]|nr:hypothetical protein [Lentisphaerales bacterium]